MKKLIIAFSLILSGALMAAPAPTAEVKIEINQDKSAERHYYNFGSVPVMMRTWVNFRVTNTGSVPLRGMGSRTWGMDFYGRDNCYGTLMPRQTCSFTIDYSPRFEGFSNGQYTLSFDQGSEIVVDLSGYGIRR